MQMLQTDEHCGVHVAIPLQTMSLCCSTTADGESVLRFYCRLRVRVVVQLQTMSQCCGSTTDNESVLQYNCRQ